MNEIIKAHNSKMNRLVNVSQVRRANELDFFTDASIKYRDYLNNPLALNFNEGKTLQDIVVNTFLEQAQNQEDGVLVRQTRLATDIKNMSQEQIKEDKEYVSTFFTRLSEIQKLGGYLIVAVEPVKPDNLPSFIANYNNLNVNGTNEKTKDRNMFMLAGWAGLFDYFNDINVEKNFTFRKTKNKEIAVLTQRIFIKISGETFEKYLHKKPYIVEDFLSNRNIYINDIGEAYYVIYGEVDSTQTPDGDLLDLYITEVPEQMDLGSTFDNGGIMVNGTLQPQYFLGGTIPQGDRNDPEQDTAIQIPMYKVVNDKLKRSIIKPINTSAINLTPAYKAEINNHIAGLFAIASGNISVLSGYTNKRLGVDLPLGINEVATKELQRLYESLSPEGKASFVGNRYQFNTISKNSTQKVSLVDAQKAFVTQLIMDSNLDIKLIQEDVPGGPSFVKETLTDQTPQGQDLIKALNDNEMPLPDFYKNMLGITEWQTGLPLYYQKLPEETTSLPAERNDQINKFVEKYS
jgi:hypothetical protein